MSDDKAQQPDFVTSAIRKACGTERCEYPACHRGAISCQPVLVFVAGMEAAAAIAETAKGTRMHVVGKYAYEGPPSGAAEIRAEMAKVKP